MILSDQISSSKILLGHILSSLHQDPLRSHFILLAQWSSQVTLQAPCIMILPGHITTSLHNDPLRLHYNPFAQWSAQVTLQAPCTMILPGHITTSLHNDPPRSHYKLLAQWSSQVTLQAPCTMILPGHITSSLHNDPKSYSQVTLQHYGLLRSHLSIYIYCLNPVKRTFGHDYHCFKFVKLSNTEAFIYRFFW